MNIETSLMREAVQWAVELRADDADEQHRLDFEAWRDADPRHAAAYERVERSLHPLHTLRLAGVSPAMAQAVTRRARARATRRGAVAFGIFGAFGLGGMFGWRGAEDAGLLADARTGTGERRHLELAAGQGSLVLDARTSLDPLGARRARLFGGRVLASVGAVVGDPWRLATPLGEVVANGARATVALRAEVLRVAALDGTVELWPQGAAGPVTVPEGRTVALARGLVATVDSSINDVLWTRGLVKLDDEPLEHLIAALQPYRAGVLRADSRVAGLRLSGVFSLDDTETTLAAVARTLPVAVTRRTPYWVTIAAA